MKFAVVVFPGIQLRSRRPPRREARARAGRRVRVAQGRVAQGADVVILPGGFAHGDYLRTGAIARFSPMMQAVKAFADAGGPVLGVCNGFQILLEAGLLPGAMLRNSGLKFHLRARQRPRRADRHAVHRRLPAGAGAAHPHQSRRRQLFREPTTCSTGWNGIGASSSVTSMPRVASRPSAANPNGAARNIAGICSERRNVVGMMPHPERACEPILGSGDGLVLFESVVRALECDGRRRDAVTMSFDTDHPGTPRPDQRRVRADRPRPGARADRSPSSASSR